MVKASRRVAEGILWGVGDRSIDPVIMKENITQSIRVVSTPREQALIQQFHPAAPIFGIVSTPRE